MACQCLLKAGEQKTVTVTLTERAFAYYNVNIHDWHVESGVYQILVGASSRDIRLDGTVDVESANPDAIVPDYRQTAPSYYEAQSRRSRPISLKCSSGAPCRLHTVSRASRLTSTAAGGREGNAMGRKAQ